MINTCGWLVHTLRNGRAAIFSLLGGWDLSAWHQQPGRINALLLLALGVYAFHAALAGRPVLGAKLDER
jgi:hypothetical protein